MKKLWSIAGAAAAFAAGGAATIGGISCRLFARTMERGKMPPTAVELDPSAENPFEEMQQKGKAWAAAHRADCSRETISRDDVQLVGYYYDQGATQSVILVHGFCGSYLDRLESAALYYERGYNVLAVDCRGHGESGGKYRTMGYKDGDDVLAWVRYLAKQKSQEFIILDGVSMGCAAVLTAAGSDDLPDEVRGVVADCGFTSIHDIFEHQLKDIMKLPTFPILNIVEWLCRKKIGISTDENTPLDCVKKIQIPVLFVHGIKDRYVPFEMGVQLNNACRSLKKLLAVRGAGHALSCWKDPDLYKGTVNRFLETLEL